MPKNILSENRYLLSSDLHKKLYLVNTKKSKDYPIFIPTYKNNSNAIYLVSFRVLNKGSNTLIYNYIKYDYDFYTSLLFYLVNRNVFIDPKVFSDKGYYFVIIDNKFLPKNFIIKPLDEVSNTGIDIDHLSDREISALQHISELDTDHLTALANRMSYVCDNQMLGVFTDMVVLQDVALFSDYLFKGLTVSQYLQPCLRGNLLNSSLYLVNNLFDLVKQLENLGYNVNEGPQKWRGQINSINSFLSNLDFDYRKSLHSHYVHHEPWLPRKDYQLLTPTSFSFNTIHQRLGNVRW